MAERLGPTEVNISLRFGGGLHSAASEEDIDARECVAGRNFTLDLEKKEFKTRNGFDKIATAPNAASINGFATLKKSNGDITFLVQAGMVVYSWDGTSFAQVGTVNSGAKLRGRFSHYSALDDKVLITDLELQEQVAEWDGTTFQNVTFTDEADNPFGDFFAKYCYVADERAYFGNVKDSSSTLPHVLVGSKTGDYTQITVTQAPSTSLNAEDPIQLTTPDLGSINGVVSAFGATAVSSEGFSMHELLGGDATDFAFKTLYSDSGAAGDESVAYVGNDIAYGRQGRIESLIATDAYGDVQSDDWTRWVREEVETVNAWTLVYNRRNQRLYAFPEGVSGIYVLFKPVLPTISANATATAGISPWSFWQTSHPMAFQPTAVMNAYHPVDGNEYVFMGDDSGGIYQLEGTSETDDSYPVTTSRTSGLFSAPLDAHMFDLEGWVKYRLKAAANINLVFLWSGDSALRKVVPIEFKADSGYAVWGGGFYWGSAHWGSAYRNRLVRATVGTQGAGNEFQIQIEGEGEFSIAEVGFRAASAR